MTDPVVLTDLHALIRKAETSADLDRAAKLLWQGHAEGLISDQAANQCDQPASPHVMGAAWRLPS
jgi:hypothetical protein